jgi:hypothetical protein
VTPIQIYLFVPSKIILTSRLCQPAPIPIKMTISESAALDSFNTPLSKTASTSLKPRQSSKNIRISLLSQKQKEKKEDGNNSSNARHRSDEVDDDDDEEEDDDNSTIQLAHTDTKSALDYTTSSYSSLRSDLKQSGSLGQGSHSISRSGSSSTSIGKVADTDDAEAVVKEEIPKTNLISTPRSVSSTLLPPSSNREFTPTFRARSGTPATLGGVLRAETPGRRSLTETDFDTSTNMSDVEEDDQSQDVTYDYTHDEEPSEYIPPMTPKVGGFGVKPSKVKPHKEGMRSAATERATRDAGKGSTSADVKMLSSSESDTWGANFWCIIEQPVSTVGRRRRRITMRAQREKRNYSTTEWPKFFCESRNGRMRLGGSSWYFCSPTTPTGTVVGII